MEIRVFKSVQDSISGKPCLCQRVILDNALCFPYDSAVRTFKAIYGDGCLIDFRVL